jgi:outer membrane protein OmpA-like peptidoglycan-associated protein
MRIALTLPLLFAFGGFAATAQAEPVRAHGALVGAGAALGPQASEFGPGGGGFAALEIPVGRRLGFEAEVGGLLLSPGEPASGVAPKGVGTLATAMGGARFRFFGRTPAGPWIGGHAGAAVTGNRVRFAFDGEVGWDFRVGGGRVDVGPFAGYVHVWEPDGGLAPEDAHVFVAGIAVSLGAPIVAVSDLDHDGIVDTDDACPTEPGPRTSDPRTNGCPVHDRDRDGVVDAEDACPGVAGIPTRDVTTNGCPLADRDHDEIPDAEDACPDDAGVKTTDPKTNGCPPDRDHDAVPDAQDACPDLVGVPSSDPTANGCPPPDDGARVVGDRIVVDDIINFDTDSARVRHISFPVVKKLADLLNKHPEIVEIYVEGHTDQTGPADWNQQLSDDRAASVKRLLVSFGVAEERITTHGYGFTRPRNAGTTPDALRQNRRVEFIITRTSTSPGGVQ